MSRKNWNFPLCPTLLGFHRFASATRTCAQEAAIFLALVTRPMIPCDSTTVNRILELFLEDIRAAILTYANESTLEPEAVIEGALKHFLELDTTLSSEPVSVAEVTSLLAALPSVLQSQAMEYAEKTEIPSELVIELAISHFLDPGSVTFDDCQVTVEQTSIAWLKQYANSESATAA